MSGEERLAEMSGELEGFCKEAGLPFESADELLLSDDLRPEHRKWLSGFCERWREAEAQSFEEYRASKRS